MRLRPKSPNAASTAMVGASPLADGLRRPLITTTAARFRGFALVELLAALAITSLLGAALFRLVDRSQRFAQGIALMADERAQISVAQFAVEGELLGIAALDGDLLAGSDSAIAYLGNVGNALVCTRAAATVDFAAPILASGVTLTWWNTAPQPGDSVMLFDEGASPGASDDRWFHTAIAAIGTLPNACLHTAYTDSIADAGSIGWRLTASQPLPATIQAGAVARIARPARIALYRSSGEWMMGWTEWNAATASWNIIQPVAGPLLPYARPGMTSGLSFGWRDSLGAAVVPAPGATARSVELGIGAVTRRAVRVDGVAWGGRRDSVTKRIPLRNTP